MLSDQAISTAGDQVKNMEARGIIVSACPGSVLDSLVRSAHCESIEVYRNDDGEYSLDAYQIKAAANTIDTVTGGCEHTLTQDEFAIKLAPIVTGFLSQARTQAAPAVEEFVKHLDEAVSMYRGTIAHDFEITTQALPAPLADSSLLDSIKKAETALPREFDLPVMGLGLTGPEAVRAAFLTGSAAMDASLNSWATAQGTDFLEKTWEQLFSDSSSVRPVSANVFFADTQEGNANLLAAFLFTRTMWDNPPEGTQLSLGNYNDKIAELRLQVGSRLNARIANSERLESNGMLVLSSFGRKIIVNQKVYTKWLQSGGVNEVLFGNALKSMPSLSVKDIDADAENCLLSWKRFAAINSVQFQNRMFTRYKEAALTEFERMMAASTHADMPLNERENIARLFKVELNKTTIDETRDLNCWALRLIAKSWFYKTDAYRILKSICDLRVTNPDLDAREAAAIAAIEYITYWISSQMVIRRPGI